MTNFEKKQTLVNKLTTLEDAVQEIPVDDDKVSDDNLVAKSKNLVEAMYNSIMGSTLGVKVAGTIASDKLNDLSKNLKQLSSNLKALQTNFDNPKQFANVHAAIADLSEFIPKVAA